MLTISTEDKSYEKILKIIKNFDCVYGTYGIHPHEAKNHKNIKSNEILEKSIQTRNSLELVKLV